MKIHIATSRWIGELCKDLAKGRGYELVDIENCDIFISIMYDTLLPEEYIKTRPCFNFHPGILPMYRGAGAFSWAIINGEKESGITLHKIDKDIDHGDIIEIRRFPITSYDTAGDLFTKAKENIVSMFLEWLPKLVKGNYTATPQNEALANIYYRKDLEKAKDLTRYLRAFTFPSKECAFYIKDGKKTYICGECK